MEQHGQEMRFQLFWPPEMGSVVDMIEGLPHELPRKYIELIIKLTQVGNIGLTYIVPDSIVRLR